MEADKKALIPKIDMQPHTIFLLCGPTGCGKSTFAEDLANLAEVNDLTFDVISSDSIRAEILGVSSVAPVAAIRKQDYQYSDAMGAVSPQAFRVLEARLKLVTSYPVNTEVVVVDTTGMDKTFRQFVKNVAWENNYRLVLVTFEYKTRSDYLYEDVTDKAKGIIEYSVRKFRQKVLPELGMKDFPNRLRIKSKTQFGWESCNDEDVETYASWLDLALTKQAQDSIELLKSCRELDYSMKPDEDPTFIIIGDSHECVDELKQLIKIATEKYMHARVVHVGDYLDRGGNTAAMVEYMYSRIGEGDIFIKGNHENYVAGRIRGELEAQPILESVYFTSLDVLLKNEELAKKFLTIFDCSKPFAILCDYEPDGSMPVIVTHAPCEAKYLGKVHGYSLREQRNYRIKNKEIPLKEELKWFYDSADKNHPLHFIGHFAHKITETNGLRYFNKVFLDTGCGYGNVLTAAIVRKGKILTTLSVKSTKTPIEGLEENLGIGPDRSKPFDIKDYDLEVRDLRLLRQIEKNDIRYISGTMAPAPSSETKIEPLDRAFEWFRKDGVTKVILEPKYMGSRCQMYFFSSGPEATFAVSRGGWRIRGIEDMSDEDYAKFLASVWREHEELIKDCGNVILDGELMPWYSLGKELIERSFKPYGHMVRGELTTLSSDPALLGMPDFLESLQLTERQEGVLRFERALSLYAEKKEPSFKAFNVLWSEKTDLDKMSHDEKWKAVRTESDPAICVDLDNKADIEKAYAFFYRLTIDLGMEGVVVKPLESPKPTEEGGKVKPGIPYMKVRSEDYLHLVYGYDYLLPVKYEKLVRQKNVGTKVSVSIREHELAREMLRAPKERREEFAVKLIGEMKREQTLDPRL